MVEPYGLLHQPHARGSLGVFRRPSSLPRPLSAIPLTRRSPAVLHPLTDLRTLSCCYITDFAAQKSGLPYLPLQASRPCRNLSSYVRSLPFYPLHFTHCGIAVFRSYPAYLLVNPRYHTVTIDPSCGKANLYIALCPPLLLSMPTLQQYRQKYPTNSSSSHYQYSL
jgi:hypothetical protein